jgi:hypothetical protein
MVKLIEDGIELYEYDFTSSGRDDASLRDAFRSFEEFENLRLRCIVQGWDEPQ